MPAACNITVTSPLTPAFLNDAGMNAGTLVAVGETHINGSKCQERGWVCVPLAFETHGNWGREALLFARIPTCCLCFSARR